MEQYKTYLDTIDHFAEKRLHLHEFFMGINSFLATLFGYMVTSEKYTLLLLLLLALVGFSFSRVWYLLVTNFTTVNSAKWKVIYDMEKKLPYQPFQSEWRGKGNLKKIKSDTPPKFFSWILPSQQTQRYYSTSNVDSELPKLFGWIYISLGIGSIIYLKFSDDIDQFWENIRSFDLEWIGIVILIPVVFTVIALMPLNKCEDSGEKSAKDSSSS